MQHNNRANYNDFALSLGRYVDNSGFNLLLLAILQRAALENDREFIGDKAVRHFYGELFHIFDLPQLFAERYC